MAYLGTPIDTTNQFQSLVGKRFSGNGSTTAFTLDVAPTSVFDIEVFVENVRQDPNSAYSLSGTTLTFTGAPASGTNNIYVVHQAKAVGTINPTNDSVTASSIADDAVESEHLNNNIISGQTALTSAPADTDEFLISDAGTIKRIDYSLIKASNTPAFYAHLSSSQSVGDASTTKAQINTEVLDTDSCYDNSSNYRFTPTTAGKYFVFGCLNHHGTDSNSVTYGGTYIYKNGGNYAGVRHNADTVDAAEAFNVYVSAIVDMNGSSDYLELYAQTNTSGGTNGQLLYDNVAKSCYFGAYRIIGA